MQKINNKICGSGDTFVGYIYNELPSTERLAFEDHLLDCTVCTDEFAAVADSRYAVYEWQKLEFEPMPTPHFAIPYTETKVSWLDSIKSIFATGPRLATAGAFGLLIVAVGFASIMLSGDLTDIVSQTSVEVVDTFPVPAQEPNVTAAVTVKKDDEIIKPNVIVVSKKIERKLSPVRRNTARSRNIGNETQAKAPRLNDFEDLSDDSLRLSDLVADIDTRD